jgi:hypothetical protein
MATASPTADSLLAIPPGEPERLFGKPELISAMYRALALRWHPDHAGRDDVFRHLVALKAEADRHAAAGLWSTPGMLEIGGRRIRHFRSFPFELGRAYLGNSLVAYVVEPDYADLAARAEESLHALGLENERMRAAMAPRLPMLRAAFDGGQGRRVLVLEKPPGTVRLRDLIDHRGGKLDPRHVAWTISELLNIACYLGVYRKLVHLDLSPDTLLIAPSQHVVIVMGGWFYATAANSPLVAVSARTERSMPASMLTSGVALPAIDLELIRAVGREALGDPAGTRLATDPAIPHALADWLRMPGSGDPVADYRRWSTVLTESFGARRFVELRVEASDIYGMEATNG